MTFGGDPLGRGSGGDQEWIPPTHVISLSQSEAQKFRLDPLPIPSKSAPDLLPKLCDLSEPLICLE